MKKVLIPLYLVLLSILSTACHQVPDAQQSVHAENQIAIQGYDVVGYFTQGKALRGDSSYTYAWNGVMWRFISDAHRQLFSADPQKYAPQYGGWCAYGASKGYKARTDPMAWTITDGKLYLNYSTEVRTTWLKDAESRIKKANMYWSSLRRI